MVGMTCYKPGERSRLFYAVREYNGRKDQPKGFGWRDFRDLIVRARIQLGGPIVLVRDNVRLHLTKPLRCGRSAVRWATTADGTSTGQSLGRNGHLTAPGAPNSACSPPDRRSGRRS